VTLFLYRLAFVFAVATLVYIVAGYLVRDLLAPEALSPVRVGIVGATAAYAKQKANRIWPKRKPGWQ
jgi:hypothetical protein